MLDPDFREVIEAIIEKSNEEIIECAKKLDFEEKKMHEIKCYKELDVEEEKIFNIKCKKKFHEDLLEKNKRYLNQ